MKEETRNTIIKSIGILVLFIIIFIGFREVGIQSKVQHQDTCKWEYGENWTYERTDPFGPTCVEVDYITLKIMDRKAFEFNATYILNKYCNDIHFFDFTKWSNDCGEDVKEDE